MKIYLCVKCGFTSDKTSCPICKGKMQPYENKNAKKAKRFPRAVPPSAKEQMRVSKIIEQCCETFMCPGDVLSAREGPIVTEYKFRPLRQTRIKNLKSLNEDLAVAIPADSVTVMRIPGEGAMAITVPNAVRHPVEFEATLAEYLKQSKGMELPINLGVTAIGDPVVFDLANMPHLLIAGSTGAGKSVLINNILCSLLYQRSPKQLELELIDPKMVELLPYSGLPHVKRPPASTTMDALAMMSNLIEEMKRRMAFLYFNKVKNLKELNEKFAAQGQELLPRKVLVIDEMAEIIVQEKKLFTDAMTSLAQLARAAGIHVIAATQRPSVDVLSGKIKVNFSARVGLRVPSVGDSRTIFGRSGAEQLLGKGDMFFSSPETPGMLRVHAPFCREQDIQKMLQLSTDLGHVHNVPADGLPKKPAPEPVVDTPIVEEVAESTAGPSYRLGLFLREKSMTWEQAQALPHSQKQSLNEEYRLWQHRQRANRR